MAAKPKLTPAQWQATQRVWEADSRQGFAWLVREHDLPVSDEGVRQKARNEGWSKLGAAKLGETAAEAGRRQDLEAQKPLTGALPADRKPTPALDSLDVRERYFVLEYAIDGNGSRAALAAGYAESGARTQASRLLARDNIKAALQEVMVTRCAELEIDGRELLRAWHAVAFLDGNELSQHRVVACRHCWGIGHAYQCTPAEYQTKRIAHIEQRAGVLERTREDIGEFPSHEFDWYDGRKDPNPECPECHGAGIADVALCDTRKLTGSARLAYCGVRKGREGIELVSLSRDRAIENLARAMGLFEDSGDVTINVTDADALGKRFAETMQRAREKQEAVLRARGLMGPADNDENKGEKHGE